MTTVVAEELRYPVGRFDPRAEVPFSRAGELIDSIAATPSRMRAAVAGLNEAQIDTPYREGGWTVRQVVHHVPDSHLNAYIRFRLALTEDTPAIRTYNESEWAKLSDARSAPIDVSLALLEALHERWVLLLRAMTESDFARGLQHPDWGRLDLWTMLRLYEWHGRHHPAHVQTLRSRNGW